MKSSGPLLVDRRLEIEIHAGADMPVAGFYDHRGVFHVWIGPEVVRAPKHAHRFRTRGVLDLMMARGLELLTPTLTVVGDRVELSATSDKYLQAPVTLSTSFALADVQRLVHPRFGEELED